jgi:hypothetical protein
MGIKVLIIKGRIAGRKEDGYV